MINFADSDSSCLTSSFVKIWYKFTKANILVPMIINTISTTNESSGFPVSFLLSVDPKINYLYMYLHVIQYVE